MHARTLPRSQHIKYFETAIIQSWADLAIILPETRPWIISCIHESWAWQSWLLIAALEGNLPSASCSGCCTAIDSITVTQQAWSTQYFLWAAELQLVGGRIVANPNVDTNNGPRTMLTSSIISVMQGMLYGGQNLWHLGNVEAMTNKLWGPCYIPTTLRQRSVMTITFWAFVAVCWFLWSLNLG